MSLIDSLRETTAVAKANMYTPSNKEMLEICIQKIIKAMKFASNDGENNIDLYFDDQYTNPVQIAGYVKMHPCMMKLCNGATLRNSTYS
jgi:hypothetical protein